MEITEFLSSLEAEYRSIGHPSIAASQSAYMRNQFIFFGIKSSDRRQVEKPFLVKAFLPPIEELEMYIKALWEKPERDFQLFALDFSVKYMKRFRENDIGILEFMVVNKSWWDTVDAIAYKLMGSYFKLYPQRREKYVKKWLSSDNIWLQRSALLFQLKYKEKMDTRLLTIGIESLLGSKEFFINKAIGWVLREYSRTNPDWVIEFVEHHSLANLSKKEALRLIK